MLLNDFPTAWVEVRINKKKCKNTDIEPSIKFSHLSGVLLLCKLGALFHCLRLALNILTQGEEFSDGGIKGGDELSRVEG